MNSIKLFLEEHAEPKYAVFSASLLNDSIPVMGVRLPCLRKYARELIKNKSWHCLWEEECESVFELTLLKGLTFAEAPMTDVERWEYIDRYIPLITNWSLCDSVCVSLRFVRHQPEDAWNRLRRYWSSEHEFAQRFGIVMLLDHFLTEAYKDRTLAVLAWIRPAGYYAEMAVAWALSVAFVSFPEQVYEILQNGDLQKNVLQMTLRKIIESRRVSPLWKERVRVLRNSTVF